MANLVHNGDQLTHGGDNLIFGAAAAGSILMALVERTISGILKDADGAVLTNKKIKFTPRGVFGGSGVTVPMETVSITTDASTAAFSISLLTNDTEGSYVRYAVLFHNGNRKYIDLAAGVSVTLDDLLNAYDGSQGASNAALLADLASDIVDLEASIEGIGSGTASFPTALSANVNNYAVTGPYVVLDNSTGGPLSVTGISAAQTTGMVLTVMNIGTSTIEFTAEDAASTAANRFAEPALLGPGERIILVYLASSRWQPFAE